MENHRLIVDSLGLFMVWWLISYTMSSFLWGPIVVWWIKRQRNEKVDLFYLFRNGSCSPGATNVGRVVGTKGKIYTILLDATKGAIAVSGALVFHFPLWVVAISGFAAMVGHAFPSFYLLIGYRGGKAVATALGVFLVIAPKVTLLALSGYVLIALYGKFFHSFPLARLARMSSVRSLTTCSIIVILASIVDGRIEVEVLSTVSTIFIILLHESNIVRLILGTELEG